MDFPLASEVHADSEFDTLIGLVKDDMGLGFVPCGQGEHVKRAERNNWTIAGNIRAIFHSLPCKAYPKTMTRHATMIAAANFNHFPAKGGVSSCCSPHVILGKKPLNYAKHCKHNFGSYVQGFHENFPSNTQRQRTVSGVHLRPVANSLSAHKIMNLETGLPNRVVKVTDSPITDHVIQAVNAVAAEQGIKSLKIESRNKVPLYPADWTAGVDHTDSDSTGGDDDSQDGDHRVPANTPCQCERDVNNEEIFDPIDEEELDEPLADENAADHRAMDVEDLIP